MRKLVGVVCLVQVLVGCDGGSDGPAQQTSTDSGSALGDAALEPAPEDGALPGADSSDEDASSGDVDAAVGCVPDGAAELCDGVDNDCDPNTQDGAGEPNLGAACDGADSDACNEGVVLCSAGKTVCGDTSADTSEVCDGVDNDCDGQADETCSKAPFTVIDFAVAGDGSSVAIGSAGGINKVRMMCFGPDGAVLRDDFEAALPDVGHNIITMSVARARVAGNIVVAFTARPTASDWRNYILFFDAQCQPVSTRQVLDSELANTGLNRRLSLSMTDDGRSYALYEHDDAKKFRALVFDAAGTRTAAVTLNRPSECAGDGRPAMLTLNATSGDFGVFCETGTTRNFRRFSASGVALDTTMRAVPDSYPSSFSFGYWAAAMNRAGSFLYFGRNNNTQWITRLYGVDGQLAQSSAIAGATGGGSPRAEVTSSGEFLIELAGPDYKLALIDAAGAVSRNWPVAPTTTPYRLDAQDNVYIAVDNGIVRSRVVSLH